VSNGGKRKSNVLNDINNNNDPKFLFLLVEQYVLSKKANSVIHDALKKFKNLMDERVRDVEHKNVALKS
jgi:hypothetical protein